MALFASVAVPRARATPQEADGGPGEDGLLAEASSLRAVVGGRPDLRAFLVANALWEASLGALKTFVFLFVATGLGYSREATAGIIGGVALLVLPAAVLSGWLADRHGRARVMSWALPAYGLGLLVPAFTGHVAVLVPVMLVIGFGGGIVMTLPYALLQPLMPAGRHGLLTGFYSLSRGIGTALGPLLAGIAIEVLHGPFADTGGYAAMWLVCGGTVLASVPAMAALRRLAGARIDHR
ncbi:MAG: MFS transporter [Solirubrobacteraceae bacterium]|nr:MFS transporter [Solirubrobacteraceae bacterium]